MRGDFDLKAWMLLATTRGKEIEKLQRRIHSQRRQLRFLRNISEILEARQLKRTIYIQNVQIEGSQLQIQKLIATIGLAEKLTGRSVAEWPELGQKLNK